MKKDGERASKFREKLLLVEGIFAVAAFLLILFTYTFLAALGVKSAREALEELEEEDW